jgi:Cu(I)/Ag(I) efflux system membrane fusion protein
MDGLKEGEMVVINGNFKIDSAIQIQAGPSMMNPEGGVVTTGHEQHGGSTPKTAKETQSISGMTEKLSPVFLTQLDAVYNAYFKLHTALSHDDSENFQNYAAGISQALKNVDMRVVKGPAHTAWMETDRALKEQAKIISKANDLIGARSAFKILSESMIHLAKEFGSSGKQPVLVYHCPMAFDNAGADWLQNKKGTENPYFGSKMFTCGSQEQDLTHSRAENTGGQRHE